LAGYYLAENEMVSKHYEKVILGIVFVSVLPVIIGLLRSKFGKKEA
jgi:membrane-associated protein